MQKVVYEEKLKIGLSLKVLLMFTFGVIIGLTVWSFHTGETVGAWILLIVLVFTAVLLFAVLPRKYQIFSDKIKVVCGLLRIDILFGDVNAVEIRPRSDIYGSLEALRFGTGTGQKCIMIKRKRGMNILIQPRNTERFMEMINSTMRA